jgi:hypothetical protein
VPSSSKGGLAGRSANAIVRAPDLVARSASAPRPAARQLVIDQAAAYPRVGDDERSIGRASIRHAFTSR